MARLIDKKRGETVYTLDLTESEVATLAASLGVTTVSQRENSEITNRFNLVYNDLRLYKFLRDDVLGLEVVD